MPAEATRGRHAVVLAAGAASRFGGGKLVAPYRGKPLVMWAVEAALASRVEGVTLILGAGADAVRKAVARLACARLRIVACPDWGEGLAASLRCGIAALPDDCAAAAIFLADMPRLDPALADRALDAVQAGAPAAVPWHADQPGHPVALSAALFGRLAALTGDHGARAVLEGLDGVVRIASEDPGCVLDIDTQADLAAADPPAVRRIAFTDAARRPAPERLARERPVAFEYNGLAYAVMLASPHDLEDFATGFTLAEGLVERADEIGDIAVAAIEGGTILRIALPEARAAPLRERVRLRLVEGSCGLCGMDSIAQVLRPLPPLGPAAPRIDAAAVARALGHFRDHQPQGRATGAMHAAAFCAPDGAILAAREDIGRHNALDKLTGHMARAGIDPAGGFALLSARCSCELVEKAVRARIPALVTISAASDLAVERAQEAGLTLVALARDDGALVMHDPHGAFPA